MSFNEEVAAGRIVFLEEVGVGCGPKCMCRAVLAATLTDEQAAELEAGTMEVDPKTSVGESGILALLKPEAKKYELQVNILKTITHDKELPDRRPGEKGGSQSAKKMLEELREWYEKLRYRSIFEDAGRFNAQDASHFRVLEEIYKA